MKGVKMKVKFFGISPVTVFRTSSIDSIEKFYLRVGLWWRKSEIGRFARRSGSRLMSILF